MKWLKCIYRWWWPDGFIGDWWKDKMKERMIDYMARLDRNAIIEECARVLDDLAKNQWDSHAQDALTSAAAAIRALKDEP